MQCENISVINLLPRSTIFFAACALLILTALPAPQAAAASKEEADALAGAILFRDKGCAHCHGANLEGTKKGPALADIRSDKQWPPDKITNQILNGGQKMPPFGDSLSDPEIAQVVTYLRAKHRPVPPPAASDSSQ